MAFRKHPQVLQVICNNSDPEINVKLGPGETQYLELMGQLRDIAMVRLMTTPNERQERNNYLHQIKQREKANNEVVGKLEVELNGTMEKKEQEVQDLLFSSFFK